MAEYTNKHLWPYRFEIVKDADLYQGWIVNVWNGEIQYSGQGHTRKAAPMNAAKRFVKLLKFFGIVMEIRDLTKGDE